jgi:hypothetical protein
VDSHWMVEWQVGSFVVEKKWYEWETQAMDAH